MMKKVLFCLASLISLTFPLILAQSDMPAIDGLISVASPYQVTETIDRIAQTVEAKGFTIIARVDHAAAASSVDIELAPTELLIFGNPKGGTPLMQCRQALGLELPLKVLAWEQTSGEVLLSYTDPQFLASRYGATGCDEVVTNISNALQTIVGEALAQ